MKKIIFGIVAFVLVFGLGMFVGTKLKSKSPAPANQENTFQAGYDAAKKRLQEKGIGVLPVGMEIKSLSGTVEKVSGNAIVLKNISTVDPLADPRLDTRTVQITKNTKFFQFVQKNPEQLQKEMEEFDVKMKEQQEQMKNVDASQPATAPQLITPPNPQEKKEISLADIKEGQNISVAANEDIKDKKEFVATEITTQAMPAYPTNPLPATAPSQAGPASTTPIGEVVAPAQATPASATN